MATTQNRKTSRGNPDNSSSHGRAFSPNACPRTTQDNTGAHSSLAKLALPHMQALSIGTCDLSDELANIKEVNHVFSRIDVTDKTISVVRGKLGTNGPCTVEQHLEDGSILQSIRTSAEGGSAHFMVHLWKPTLTENATCSKLAAIVTGDPARLLFEKAVGKVFLTRLIAKRALNESISFRAAEHKIVEEILNNGSIEYLGGEQYPNGIARGRGAFQDICFGVVIKPEGGRFGQNPSAAIACSQFAKEFFGRTDVVPPITAARIVVDGAPRECSVQYFMNRVSEVTSPEQLTTKELRLAYLFALVTGDSEHYVGRNLFSRDQKLVYLDMDGACQPTSKINSLHGVYNDFLRQFKTMALTNEEEVLLQSFDIPRLSRIFDAPGVTNFVFMPDKSPYEVSKEKVIADTRSRIEDLLNSSKNPAGSTMLENTLKDFSNLVTTIGALREIGAADTPTASSLIPQADKTLKVLRVNQEQLSTRQKKQLDWLVQMYMEHDEPDKS